MSRTKRERQSGRLKALERRLLLKLLDAGTLNFIAGFRLAWKLSAELNMDTNERPASGSERPEESAHF